MFRRSGSVVPYYIDGENPDPTGDSFLEALQEYRFRTIENAASEETAVGWVTQQDPTGSSFDREHIEFDGYYWLRMRIDKKAVPAAWLSIYRASAERAAGRKLNTKERRDLREDLMQKLLPRVLPTVAMFDAVLFPERNMVFLHASSKSAKEAFTGLFYRTFRSSLKMADPFHMAINLKLGRDHESYLDEVSPVAWPRISRQKSTDLPEREIVAPEKTATAASERSEEATE